MAATNIIDKIWNSHVVTQQSGHPALLAIDFILLHEVTSAQAFDALKQRNLAVYDAQHCLATVDHSIPTRPDRHIIHDSAAKHQVEQLRSNVKAYNIPFYDFDSEHQGIVHVVGPELGATQPGMTIVCGDSHTSTHGAFGALAFGIGTSVVGHVLASGCLLMRKPKTFCVNFTGRLQKGVFAKDAIMKLIAEIGIGGATGHVIEYRGEEISRMSMEQRMTICNMSIECGAVAGLIAPDNVTFNYIEGRKYAPKDAKWQLAKQYWLSLASDAGCHYDREITIDLDSLEPMVTWGTNPSQAVAINDVIPEINSAEQLALDYVRLKAGQALQDTPVDWAFIGSCTNGRIEDLRIAAQVLKGQKIKQGLTLYIVPGSEQVLAQAKKEGLDRIFRDAGADFRMPGCSMCLGMNDDKVPSGKRCVSSTNRNFVGRQGPGSITHLASPATVAASAIEGKITSARDYL